MENDKKMAAAVAAVFEYIRAEEEVLCLQAAQVPAMEALKPPPQTAVNLWGLSGRQELMHMAHLMQMKVFNRLR
jgi:hypothetical protein